MIEIDEQYLYIDLEAIHEFVFKKDEDARVVDAETIIDANGNVIQTTEVNKDDSEKKENVRYDMVKAMLDVLYNTGVESIEGNMGYIQDVNELSIGGKLIINTLQAHNFLKNKLN